jgi:Fe2+ transport system protein B
MIEGFLFLKQNNIMEKLNKFFKEHGTKLIVLLLILNYFKSCGVSSDLNKLKKETKQLEVKLNELPSKTDLEIEGLKSEKRMIQASDRKILDVQRQTEIDNEIKKLQNK